MDDQNNRPSTTEQWQQRIIDAWQPGTLILTSGGRLARQLIHRYRQQQRENGHKSWQPLEARSLNGWLNQYWQNLWDDEAFGMKSFVIIRRQPIYLWTYLSARRWIKPMGF